MIRDEELRQVVDYSEGQKTAAYMILGEIVNLLGDLADNIRLYWWLGTFALISGERPYRLNRRRYIIKPTSNKKGREL